MKYLGDFGAGDVVYIGWRSSGQSGGSLNPSANGTLKIYKNGGTTERTSLNGVTDTLIFDSHDGLHLIAINLADNTDAGFFAAGNDYQVARVNMTVDGQTISEWLGQFSIDKRRALADVKKVDGDATAANTLMRGLQSATVFVVDTANLTPTTTQFETNITEATAVHFVGSAIGWATGALKGQRCKIAAYSLVSGKGRFTVVGESTGVMTDAPANGDVGIILP